MRSFAHNGMATQTAPVSGVTGASHGRSFQ